MRRLRTIFSCAIVSSAWAQPTSRTGTTHVSANGIFGVRMVQTAKDQCRLEIVRDQVVDAHVDKCLGDVDDLYFVSNDGARVWLLRTVPELPHGRHASLKTTIVAQLFSREGSLLKSKRLGELIHRRGQLEEVRKLGKHFKWLGGVASVPGNTPHVTNDGQVELEVVGSDGKAQRLRF